MRNLIPSAFYFPVTIGVYNSAQSRQKRLAINIDIQPSIPIFDTLTLSFPWELEIIPIPIPLKDSLINSVRRLTAGKIESFFDDTRIGKTLLNFGQDFQSLILNWKYVSPSSIESDAIDAQNGGSLFLKLYKPLPPEIDILSECWIVRELSPSYLDQLFVVFVPGEGLRVYLRPPNKNVNVRNIDGSQIDNVTMRDLFTTGSFDGANLTDPVLEQWFVTAVEGAELNVAYNDFSNFVFYSSAQARLNAFRNKLVLLEDFENVIQEQSSSLAASGITSITGSLAYGGLKNISEQKVDLIRSFDAFERFLFYESDVPYSSSFSGDNGKMDQIYFMSDMTWPKVNGIPITVQSASSADLYGIAAGSQLVPEGDFSGLVSWLDAISYIASSYDLQNQNRLAGNLPTYIIEDPNSVDFITFMDMIGHQFDVIKLYADALKLIYNRSSDPLEGLSPDVIWNIASSFGVDLPSQYSLKSLVDYTVGDIGSVSSKIYRELATETWKRFLHNHMFLIKTKGTKTALRTLLNIYGVLPTSVQIRESSVPSSQVTHSYELIEETTNALDIDIGAHVLIPYDPTISTIQIRMSTLASTESVLFNVDSEWGIKLTPTFPESVDGIVEVFNSVGTSVVSSSVHPLLFSGEFYNITVQQISPSVILLWSIRTDLEGDFAEISVQTGSLSNWATGSILYLGSSGSLQGQPFIGLIDEFRMWTETITESNIKFHAQYPGLYHGNTVFSAKDNLPVRLSFNKPRNLGIPTSSLQRLPNEAPGSVISEFTASGFLNEPIWPLSMETVNRTILRYSPNIGTSQFVSNKITIEPPAIPIVMEDISSGEKIPVLSHNKSMVSVDDKRLNRESSNTIGFFFSPIDAINDSIIKVFGSIDLQDLIGDPRFLYTNQYPPLEELNKLYWTNYSFVHNFNSYMEFVENLLTPMFSQAKQLIPAKAKLLSGIVLESPILERNKIQLSPVNVSGLGTRNADMTPTLEANAITSAPNTTTGQFIESTAILDIVEDNQIISNVEINLLTSSIDVENEFLEVSANKSYHETLIEISDIDKLKANTSYYDTNLPIGVSNEVDTQFIVIDSITELNDFSRSLLTKFGVVSVSQLVDPDKTFFNLLVQNFIGGSVIGISSGTTLAVPNFVNVNTINPRVDFSQNGAITYFDRPDGKVVVFVLNLKRLNESILIDLGTWNPTTTYVKNDFVVQLNQTGPAASGNGKEYVCIAPALSTGITSNNPPSIDMVNWKPMQFVAEQSSSIQFAVLLNDKVELISSLGTNPPFSGYHSSHYRFFRDMRRGTICHQWLGCVQTDDTTPDGGPAVEVIPSAGDILVVASGATPIQRTTDEGGPILDVR